MTAPRWLRAGFSVLGRHRLLLAGSTLLALAQRARLVPRRAGLARLPIRRGPPVRSTGGDVWLFTGCVMDAWMRDTHRAAAALVSADWRHLRRLAARMLRRPARPRRAGARRPAELAERVVRSMPGEAPILVDSAGCGAAMKDYGRLLGTADAVAFADRVVDIHEWLAERVGTLPEPARAIDRDRPGPVPPPPRAAGPRRRAHRARSRRRRRRARRRRPVLRRRRRLLGAAAGTRRRRSASASSPPSPGRRSDRAPGSSPAPTPAAPCTSPLPASRCAIPSTSSPRPSTREPLRGSRRATGGDRR